jgi:hypothetical protein
VTIDPLHLLHRLNPGVRPVADRRRTPVERAGFSSLLTVVLDGEVRSDEPVNVDDLPQRGELSDEHLARLSAAGDLAESHGFARALMLIDGRALIMDVDGRRITEEAHGGPNDRAIDVDGAVYVAPAEDTLSGGPASGLADSPRPISRAGGNSGGGGGNSGGGNSGGGNSGGGGVPPPGGGVIPPAVAEQIERLSGKKTSRQPTHQATTTPRALRAAG